MNDPTLDLAAYILELLEPEERAQLEEELRGRPDLHDELSAFRETLGALPTAAVAVQEVPSQGKSRLLAALDSGERYAPFLRDLCRAFDLSTERVKTLLNGIDNPVSWTPGPLPGIQVMHFAGGAAALAHDTGFVRLPRGLAFPYHRHVGHEITYVLEGAIRDGDGTLYVPGEAVVMGPASAHEFSVLGESDALIAVVQAGFEFIAKP